ncbi:copper chaperone PCu(A)C [Paracoccus bogoriensis]|uniref:copper chaperone PCu(A)C n=1 Tax=Paracoccus bogoriensis TaxID=242065 RepID=UPI001C66D8B3|nr:copper chaperone PCu(A)C [Paracoccus bogoriensis]MBW7056773.1 copper chaperone PCu(A)C [Paracoccus bogoriensis]
MTKLAFFAGAIALVPFAALAHDGMHVNDAYARSANPMTGAVFMELENHREVDCTLVSAASDAAERVELHTHLHEDGVMKMVEVEEGFLIPAGETRLLDRGGDHVMLLGLTQPLADGDIVRLSLDFGECGTEEIEAVVDNQRMGGGHGQGHGHGDSEAHDHGHSHAEGEHKSH